jgi:colanic acid/amylovoran biosynthesis glycosyltransferase
MPDSPSPIRAVVHSHPIWLPQTQTWLFNQIRSLPPRYRSHVVCEQVQNLDQFPVERLDALEEQPRWPRTRDLVLRKLRVRRHLGLLREVIRREGAAVVHSHFGNIGWADAGALRGTAARHVVTFYGFDVNQLPRVSPRWRQRYHRLFDHVDRVLCEGPHMAECIRELGCPGEKVRVHHLGVQLGEIAFLPRVWDGSSPLRVLIAATFREKKGVPYALEALGRLSARVPVEITVVGEASPEPRSQAERVRIMGILDRYDLHDRTRLLGFQPQSVLMKEAYEHHVFLSPSVTAADGDTEGGAPVSIIEMAASGMPVVSTTHCDIPNVLGGETGLLVGERDVDGLVAALERLADSAGTWDPMLRSVRNRLEREFSSELQGEALARVYDHLLER